MVMAPDRSNQVHEAEMAANGIGKIDLVVMNLYPFEATVASGAEFRYGAVSNSQIKHDW